MMLSREINLRFGAAIVSHESSVMRELLRDHADDILDHSGMRSFLRIAAENNNIEAMQLIVERCGDDLISPKTEHPPLFSAVHGHALDAARWLISRGSIINQYPEQGGICFSLNVAAREGPLEMVRLLVESGANFNAVFERNTPLSLAIKYNQPEIAEYLRSQGALEPSPCPEGPIFDYMRKHVGEPEPLGIEALLPSDPEVTIYYIFTASELVLFTHGMSRRPMHTPPGKDAFQYVELVVHLPDGWPVDVFTLSVTPERMWIYHWLLRLANLPFGADTWIGHPMGIIANGEPPETLSPFTAMTCWMLVEGGRGLSPLDLPDRRVWFYHAVPLYTDERDFERRESDVRLLKVLDENGVGLMLTVDPERPSVLN